MLKLQHDWWTQNKCKDVQLDILMDLYIFSYKNHINPNRTLHGQGKYKDVITRKGDHTETT